MASAANGDYPYHIDLSGAMGETIRRLQRQATREGRGREFLLAFRTVVERLHHDPFDFGEPLYQLAALKIQVRCAVVRPLSVDFAVCEDQPLVFIKAVRLLSAQVS